MPNNPSVLAREEPAKPSHPPAPAWMCMLFGLMWIPLPVLIFSPEVDGVVKVVWGLLLGLPLLGGLALAPLWYDCFLVRVAMLIASAVAAVLVGIEYIFLFLCQF